MADPGSEGYEKHQAIGKALRDRRIKKIGTRLAHLKEAGALNLLRNAGIFIAGEFIERLEIFEVTPWVGPNGSINPATLQEVLYGENIAFVATPISTEFKVDKWRVNGAIAQSGGAVFTLGNVRSTTSVEVTFIPRFVTVTPRAGPNGSITPDSVQTIENGSGRTFTATPNSGFVVDVWRVNGFILQTGGDGFPLSNVTANVTVDVTFKVAPVTVTPSAGANGSISPSSVQEVTPGSNVTFSAFPDTGYAVNQWLVNGTVVQNGGNSYTLNSVTSNRTVHVTFKSAASSFNYSGTIPAQGTTIINAETGSSVSASVSSSMTISYNASANTYTIDISWSLTSPSYPGSSISHQAITDGSGVPPSILGMSIPATAGNGSGADLSLSQNGNSYSGTVTLSTRWQTTFSGRPTQTGTAVTTHSVTVQ